MTVPTPEATPAPTPALQGEPADLGDGGKKALAEERAARQAAEKAGKALQAELDKLKQAQMSDLERAQATATASAKEAAEAKAEALRWRIAAKHGISDQDAETFLTGTDEASLTKQAERLATLNKATPATSPAPRADLSQGGKANAAPGNPEQDFANFLQNALSGR
jgi:hypothetical protein